MTIIVNGYKDIIKEIEAQAKEEIDLINQKLKEEKAILKKNYNLKEKEEDESFLKECSKLQEREYKKLIALAKIRFRDEILNFKEDIFKKTLSKLDEYVKDLPLVEKKKIIKRLVKNSDSIEDIKSIQVTKGTMKSSLSLKANLDEFGALFVASDGACYDFRYPALKEQNLGELRKIISNELF